MNYSTNGSGDERPFGALSHDGTNLSGPEAVSALMDGRLRGAAFAQAVESVQLNAQMRAAWQTYHAVGELLRRGQGVDCIGASDDFAARLALRLAAEPLPKPFGPMAVAAVIDQAEAETAMPADPLTADTTATAPSGVRYPAANDPLWRWRAVAGVTTAVAFGAIGWNLLSGAVTAPTANAPVLARAEPQRSPPPMSQHQQMIRDPRLDQLLAAHEQAGGISALQMPAGFLRNATFEGRGR